jgi:hypothetical protein
MAFYKEIEKIEPDYPFKLIDLNQYSIEQLKLHIKIAGQQENKVFF